MIFSFIFVCGQVEIEDGRIRPTDLSSWIQTHNLVPCMVVNHLRSSAKEERKKAAPTNSSILAF